jgi:DNA topoisomerase-1
LNFLLARNPTISLQLAQIQRLNMADHLPTAKSNERISLKDMKKMDDEVPHTDHVEPGISIRMGPVDAEDKMDVDASETNGNSNGKRKARSNSTNGKLYKDASSSEEDDKPLVRLSRIHYARCAMLMSSSE